MPSPLALRDLDFKEIPVEFTASAGTKYTRWLRVGMPKINQEVIKSAFFLYLNETDAKAGKNAQGTGFLVSHEDHFYGITNHHVACSGGASVIRLNTINGIEIIPFDASDWEYMPNGDDVAAVQVELAHGKHDVRSISTELFVAEDNMDIGVGEDVFMIGMFADHEGRDRNNPLARFGNISMLPKPEAKVKTKHGENESYIIDMHSRSGFSGSPVFAYRTFGNDLTNFNEVVAANILDSETSRRTQVPSMMLMDLSGGIMFKFLGIHYAHFPEQMKTDAGIGIEGHSGMTCVVPAWKILELLNIPKLRDIRDKKNQEQKYSTAVLDSVDDIDQRRDKTLKNMLKM